MKYAITMWLIIAGLTHAGSLQFKESSKELHAPADAREVTADFEFTNKTNKPVKIVKSDPGCTCVSVQISNGKMTYAPGESGLIRAKFDMLNFSGSVDKAIGLWLDNDAADVPSMTLKLKVHIPVLIAIEPKTLRWDVNAKADPQTIHITMIEGQKIRVVGVKPSTNAFVCQLKTVEEGRRYEIIVTPTDTKSPGMGVFRIETDCQVEKQRIQQAFALVTKSTAAASAGKR
jgi:hypothetical protein